MDTAAKWWVSLWDRRASGGLGEQDLQIGNTPPARFNAATSHLKGTAGDQITQSEVYLILLATDALHIDSFGEYHIGYRNPTSRVWDGSRPLYGGFILDHTGHFEQQRHLFDCVVPNHNILFDRTEVLTWPTDISGPPAGYPAGYSVTDWLVGLASGGKPYDGIIPAHFQHVDLSGVESVFNSIILDAAYLPAQGDSELFGHFGFMSVRALLDEMVKVARAKALYMGLDIKPIYYWKLIPSGTTLIPKFYFIDERNTGATPDATYAQNPASGELKIEYPYRHRRNAQPVRTRVTVKGEGADLSGVIYYSYLKADGDAAYPTYYQKRAGWAGAPINESTINTRAQAQRYATALGDAIWGPEGTITFPTRDLRQAGDRVAINFPPDGQTGQVYPVIDVEVALNPGSPIDSLTVGQRPRDLADILIPRPDAPMPITDAGAQGGGGLNASAASLGGAGAQVAGGVKTRPTVTLPVHSDQNRIAPRTQDVTALTVQATTNVPPGTTPAVAPLIMHKDPAGNVRNWASGTDGTDHPHHYTFPVAAAGAVPFVIPDPAVLVTEKILNLDGTVNGAVTTTYQKNGATVSNPTVGTPITVARYDVLTITFAGTVPPGGIAFLLSEAPPL